jgi:hypothetical protein
MVGGVEAPVFDLMGKKYSLASFGRSPVSLLVVGPPTGQAMKVEAVLNTLATLTLLRDHLGEMPDDGDGGEGAVEFNMLNWAGRANLASELNPSVLEALLTLCSLSPYLQATAAMMTQVGL